MGTRSTIAIERADGTIAQIYCHWDGYLSHNGKLLQEHYNTPNAIEQLIALCDVSSLAAEIGEKHPFSKYECKSGEEYDEAKYENWTLFYGRDRGEEGCEAEIYSSYADYVLSSQKEEYNYLFREGRWQYTQDGNRISALLKESLELEEDLKEVM
jgi:hypothetical protein